MPTASRRAGLVALACVLVLAFGVPFAVSSCQFDSRSEAEGLADLHTGLADSGQRAFIEFDDESRLTIRVSTLTESGTLCYVLLDDAFLQHDGGSGSELDLSGHLFCP